MCLISVSNVELDNNIRVWLYHLDPLHPNISMHILHTVLCTFPKVLTRRTCQKSKASLLGDHFFYSRDRFVSFRGDIVKRN